MSTSVIQSVYTGEIASDAGNPIKPKPSKGMSMEKSIKLGSSSFPAHSPEHPKWTQKLSTNEVWCQSNLGTTSNYYQIETRKTLLLEYLLHPDSAYLVQITEKLRQIHEVQLPLCRIRCLDWKMHWTSGGGDNLNLKSEGTLCNGKLVEKICLWECVILAKFRDS